MRIRSASSGSVVVPSSVRIAEYRLQASGGTGAGAIGGVPSGSGGGSGGACVLGRFKVSFGDTVSWAPGAPGAANAGAAGSTGTNATVSLNAVQKALSACGNPGGVGALTNAGSSPTSGSSSGEIIRRGEAGEAGTGSYGGRGGEAGGYTADGGTGLYESGDGGARKTTRGAGNAGLAPGGGGSGAFDDGGGFANLAGGVGGAGVVTIAWESNPPCQWAECTVSNSYSDSRDGGVPWTLGVSHKAGDTSAQQSEASADDAGSMGAGGSSYCDYVSLADGEISEWIVCKGVPLVGVDEQGNISIRATDSIVDFEASLACGRISGTGTVRVYAARFAVDTVIDTEELSDEEVFFQADNTSTSGLHRSPRFHGLGTLSPTVADVNAGKCGIAVRVIATGGSAVAGINCTLLKIGTQAANFAIHISSIASQPDVKMVPYAYRTHHQRNEFGDRRPRDVLCWGQMTGHPSTWDPGVATVPIPGMPDQHKYWDIRYQEGYNSAWLCTEVGAHTFTAGMKCRDGLEVQDTENFTTVANTRLQVYLDLAATAGTGDGLSWPNAFTDVNTALAFINSNPTETQLNVRAGAYTINPQFVTVDWTRVYLQGEAGVYFQTTTAVTEAFFQIGGTTKQLVICDIVFRTSNGTDPSIGFAILNGAQDVYMRNVLPGDQAHRLKSFMVNTSGTNTRRGITLDQSGGNAGAVEYNFGFFGNTTDVVMIGCRARTAESINHEGLLRFSCGMDHHYDKCRVSMIACNFDSNGFQQAFRGGGCYIRYTACNFEGITSTLVRTNEVSSGDSSTNTLAHSQQVSRCFINNQSLSVGSTDVLIDSCVVYNGTLGVGYTYNGARVKIVHTTVICQAGVGGGDPSGISMAQFFSTNTPHSCEFINCLLGLVDPTVDDQSYYIYNTGVLGVMFEKAANNLFPLKTTGTARNNYRMQNVAKTYAQMAALSWMENSVQHRSLCDAQMPASRVRAHRRTVVSSTISSVTSTTVFVINGLTAASNSFNGQRVTIGAHSAVEVQSWVLSTHTLTTTTAVTGVSSGDVVTITSDDTALQGVGKTADNDVSFVDIRGCTRTLSGTNAMPGASEYIPEADPSSIALTPGIGSFNLTFTYGGSDLGSVTYLAYYRKVGDLIWNLHGPVSTGDDITGLAEGTDYEVGVVAMYAAGGETNLADVTTATATTLTSGGGGGGGSTIAPSNLLGTFVGMGM